jgi:hypothetical protein
MLVFASVIGFALGVWSIYWARSDYGQRRSWWGRRLYIGTLLLLGGGILVAALTYADGLVSISLIAGILLVAMLWETPVALQDESARVVNDSIA